MELQISVKDEKADFFLQMLKEFKDDMIKKVEIIDNSDIDNKEQKEIEQIFNSLTKEDKKIAFSKTVTIEI